MRRMLPLTFALSLAILVGCDHPQQPATGQQTGESASPVAPRPVLATRSSSAAVPAPAKTETKVGSAPLVKVEPAGLVNARQPSAPPPASPAGDSVTCALVPDPALNLPDSAVVNLLGVELSRQPGLALLERAEVDKLLKERSLQLAFAPEGVGERRALGTLLKARLLVILRAGERMAAGKPQRWIEMAVCDADSGLRLLQEKTPWDDAQPQGCLAALAGAIRQVRLKLGEKVRAIVAVPPFVSDDLLHWYDALQDAYPRLMIENFMAVPGLHVVELAEARALLDEERLSAAGAVRRPIAAFFVSGRYRNEGSGSGRTVKLTLELRRGEQRADQAEGKALKAGAEGDFLARTCRQWAGRMIQGAQAAFDPRQETAELRRKAAVLEQLGDSGRALGMIEAALLLEPEQGELHAKAAELCGHIADASFYDPELDARAYADNARRGLAAARRGCEHLEIYLAGLEEAKWRKKIPARSFDNSPEKQAFHALLEGFWLGGKRIFDARRADPEIARMVSDLGKAKRGLMLALYERMAARGQTNLADYWNGHHVAYERIDGDYVNRRDEIESLDYVLYDCNPIDEPLESVYNVRLKAIGLSRRILGKGGFYYIEQYATFRLDLTAPGYQAFLARVAALGKDENWNSLIGRLRKRVELAVQEKDRNTRELAARTARENEPYVRETPPPANPADEYRVVPIAEVKFTPVAWVAAGGADLIASSTDVYIMRRRGELTRLYHAADRDPVKGMVEHRIRRLVYDGRYAWIVQQQDRLLVLDPTSGAVEVIDAQQGLPPGQMEIAPLAPGRACVVGGQDRAWAATVEFRPSGKSSVDIFHEARLQTGEWTDPRLAFQPTFAVTVRDPAGTEPPRVLVGRYCVGRASHLPLLLDPQARTARVIPQRISNVLRAPGLTEHDGSAWWIERNADLEALDGITYGRRKAPINQALMEEAAIKGMEAKGKKLYHGEPLKPGQKLESEPLRLLTLGVEEVQPLPAKPFSRLIRLGPPNWRPEAVHNNLPNPEAYQNSLGFWDAVEDLVGFLDGQCFVFTNDCWWLDAERGRMVKLNGVAGFNQGGIQRLFRSSLYGLVACSNGFRGWDANCYQFVPTFDPARVRARAEEKAAGRETRNQNPLELRPVVVRLHPDWQHAPDTFTTLTAHIDGEAIVFEHDVAISQAALVVHPADQPDPAVRRLLCDTPLVFLKPSGSSRWEDAQSCSRYIPLRLDQLSIIPPPRLALLQDALGRPISGSEVKFGFSLEPGSGGALTQHILCGGFRTDASGRIQRVSDYREWFLDDPMRYVINHPDYGTAEIDKEALTFAANQPGVDTLIRVPMVSRSAPEDRLSLRGQVVDGTGKPLAAAMVTVLLMIEPSGAGHDLARVPVYCGRDGRFRLYPLPPYPDKTGVKGMQPGARFVVVIQDLNSSGTTPLCLMLDNTKEQIINWDEGLAPHRFVIQDENGNLVNSSSGGLEITYRCGNEVAELGRRMKITIPNQWDGSRSMGELTPKRIGWYDVRPAGGAEPVPVEITASSPRDIIVKLTRAQIHPPQPAPGSAMAMGGGVRDAGAPSLTFVSTDDTSSAKPGDTRILIRFTDAAARPLAGAEVEIRKSRPEGNRMFATNSRPNPFVNAGNRTPQGTPASGKTFKVRADSDGKIFALCGEYFYRDGMGWECSVTHPDYGSAWCQLPYLASPRTGNTAGLAPPLPGVKAPATPPQPRDITIAFPLARRGDPEAVSGRLLDAQGQPVAGAHIVLRPSSQPPSGAPVWPSGLFAFGPLGLSDATGHFRIVPSRPGGPVTVKTTASPAPGAAGIPNYRLFVLLSRASGNQTCILTARPGEDQEFRMDPSSMVSKKGAPGARLPFQRGTARPIPPGPGALVTTSRPSMPKTAK